MRARIGIADTGREIEVDVEGRDQIVESLEAAYRDRTPMLWFKNAKGRDIGVPLARLAFVELMDDSDQRVGFSR